MKTTKVLLAIAAAAVMAACSTPKAKVPIYAWEGINEKTDMDELSEKYRFWKSHDSSESAWAAVISMWSRKLRSGHTLKALSTMLGSER